MNYFGYRYCALKYEKLITSIILIMIGLGAIVVLYTEIPSDKHTFEDRYLAYIGMVMIIGVIIGFLSYVNMRPECFTNLSHDKLPNDIDNTRATTVTGGQYRCNQIVGDSTINSDTTIKQDLFVNRNAQVDGNLNVGRTLKIGDWQIYQDETGRLIFSRNNQGIIMVSDGGCNRLRPLNGDCGSDGNSSHHFRIEW